jgi:hypothetical protein
LTDGIPIPEEVLRFLDANIDSIEQLELPRIIGESPDRQWNVQEFHRFWRDARDRLFGLFALSFLVLAVNRVALILLQTQGINPDYFFWIRFVAFAVILIAVLDKNRSSLTGSK